MTPGALVALLVLVLAVLPPGLAVVRALGLGATGLERAVLGAALGRLGFGVVVLALAQAGRLAWLPVWCVVGVGALALARRRPAAGAPGAGAPPPASRSAGWGVAILACVAAAALLVHATVARSGREVEPGATAGPGQTRGDLLFYGRDATNDPLVYLSMALRLEQSGLPLTLPFAGGGAVTSTYLPYAVLAGTHALSRADGLDVAFRALPLFDAALAALAACALAARLGAGPLGGGAAGVLLALGSEPSFLVAPLAALAGRPTQSLDSWALFGPYLLAFNPIAAALGAFFAALILLATPAQPSRRAALVAGLLVASLIETKLFLFASAFAGLCAAAALRPPRGAARALRTAAAVALVASLPSLVEKALWGRWLVGRDDTAFHLCVGCLPRYLVDAACGSRDLSFALFRAARPGDVLAPDALLSALGASALVAVLALGARASAFPLVREALRPRAIDASDAARHGAVRVAGGAAAAGLALALFVVVSPHYLNGAQFAWSATFGLWPLAAVVLERWLRNRRFVAVALALACALPSTVTMLSRLGYGARPSLRVSAAERDLLDAVAAQSRPGDVVLEPSMLEGADRPSPVPWIAGRPVYFSLLSAVLSMPEAERDARFDGLVAVFVGSDVGAADAAIRRSGARLVVTTPLHPLRWTAFDRLDLLHEGPAGRVYRVRDR